MQVIYTRKLGNNYDVIYDSQLTQFIIEVIMYIIWVHICLIIWMMNDILHYIYS